MLEVDTVGQARSRSATAGFGDRLEGVSVMLGLAGFLATASVVFSGVQPQLAAVGERVYLVFGRGAGISVARSLDAGETFSAPASLPVSGKLALGMRRGPRVAATQNAVLVTAVVGARGGGADGDVVAYRSTDGGSTWAAPVVVNDVPGAAREGLHAMAASPGGLVVIAWLDLRERGMRLYTAVSRDHGATWLPDALVYASPSGSICECCHPSVGIDEDGRIAIMFRNNLDGNRDMFVVRSGDARTFGSATKVGTRSWTLNACPMDGGGVALGDEGMVAAWRREDGIFLSTAAIAEQRVGTGRDPVVAQSGARRDLAWSSAAGIALMRNSAEPMLLGAGRFPTILAFPNKTVVAWEDKGSITLRAVPR
jgi:hypothetical protein